MVGDLQPKARRESTWATWAGGDEALPVPAPLDAVLCTDELRRRPARASDYAAEGRALAALHEALERRGGNFVHELVARALALCAAHSAGLSLLEADEAGRRRF